MSNLNSLLESSNQWKSMQSDAARLANKWEQTGLLEGLKSETEKNNMSVILENQAKQLVVETSQTGGGTSSTGTFTAGQGEQWAGIALPLVRKVFGQIAAKDFVSVQPMSLPSGLVFFLDFQYGTDKFTLGGDKFANGGRVFGSGSMYGVTDGDTNLGVEDIPAEGLYGAGKWTYSSNTTQSAAVATPTNATASWSDTGYESRNSISESIRIAGLRKVSINTSSLEFPDLDGVRGFFISGLNGGAGFFPEYTNFNATAGTVEFFISGAADTDVTQAIVTYPQQPTDKFRGDFEDGNTSVNGENTQINIPEINIKMKSEAIVAKTKKLKAVWTPEFAQDLNAYHSLDAEAELTSIMSEYIALEIDLEILDMLLENALTTEYWSAVNNQIASSSTSGLST